MQEDRRIALIGLMGSGKSTIGRGLSEALNWPLMDMDRMIEDRSGKSVPAFFRDKGEVAFREVEKTVLEDVARTPGPLVLATGGGVPLEASNRAMLRENFAVVWLRVSPEEAARRLSGATDRPLLEGGDTKAKLEGLLEARGGLYSRVAALALDPAEPGTLIKTLQQWTLK